MARRAVLVAALFTLSAPVGAGVCTVPGSHALVQDAVDDPACTTVEVAAGTHAESVYVGRSVTVSGPETGVAVLAGTVRAEGAGDLVTLRDLRVENGCRGRGASAGAGATLATDGVAVLRQAGLPCPPFGLFSDDFESGDTGAWSSTVARPAMGTAEASGLPGG